MKKLYLYVTSRANLAYVIISRSDIETNVDRHAACFLKFNLNFVHFKFFAKFLKHELPIIFRIVSGVLILHNRIM